MLHRSGSLLLIALGAAACVDVDDPEPPPGDAPWLYGGSATSDLARRWPNGVVRFRIASGVRQATADKIRARLDTIEKMTPLRFNDIGSRTDGNYIEYQELDPDGTGAHGRSQSVGMAGNGMQYVRFYIQDGGGVPDGSTIIHETFHAVGFHHEQGRPDRNEWIVVRNACIKPGSRTEFEIRTSTLDLGPYDFDSIMHYDSDRFGISPTPPDCHLDGDFNGNGIEEHYTDTMHRRSNGAPIETPNTMSREDINAVWRMYPKKLGDGELGDHFGKALAVGDFDGDGYDDVAIGIPDEGVGSVAGGAIHIMRGTSDRLVPWKRIIQSDLPEQIVEDGDEFGAALFADDIDNDGRDDLLIGAPGEDFAYEDVGIVFLMRGTGDGTALAWDRTYTQIGFGLGAHEENDRFGASVASGRLVHSGWRDAIAIGAPGERNITGGVEVASGAVFLVAEKRTPGAGVNRIQQKLFDPDAAAGSNFGKALAVGYFGGIASTLVVGAPDEMTRGAIHIYNGRFADPDRQGPNVPLVDFALRVRPTLPEVRDFGAAVAIGRLKGDLSSMPEIVVGAPGTDIGVQSGAGAVFEYEVASLPFALVNLPWQKLTQSSPEDGDRFGAALAVADLVPASEQDDLAVGAPDEDGGEGAVTVFRGNAGDTTLWRSFRNSGFATQLDEREDHFGTALAVGNLDGVGDDLSSDDFGNPELEFADLIIGIPGEGMDIGVGHELAPEAGAAGVLRGDPAGVEVNRAYFQSSATRE